MNDHHAEYILQALLYVSRLAAQDDYRSASALGLRPDQIRTIGSMSLQNLQDLALAVKTRFFRARHSALMTSMQRCASSGTNRPSARRSSG